MTRKRQVDASGRRPVGCRGPRDWWGRRRGDLVDLDAPRFSPARTKELPKKVLRRVRVADPSRDRSDSGTWRCPGGSDEKGAPAAIFLKSEGTIFANKVKQPSRRRSVPVQYRAVVGEGEGGRRGTGRLRRLADHRDQQNDAAAPPLTLRVRLGRGTGGRSRGVPTTVQKKHSPCSRRSAARRYSRQRTGWAGVPPAPPPHPPSTGLPGILQTGAAVDGRRRLAPTGRVSEAAPRWPLRVAVGSSEAVDGEALRSHVHRGRCVRLLRVAIGPSPASRTAGCLVQGRGRPRRRRAGRQKPGVA